jgi:plasmid maintenance system killer protein
MSHLLGRTSSTITGAVVGQFLERLRRPWVNGNWRMTFGFEGEDAILVDYEDYH